MSFNVQESSCCRCELVRSPGGTGRVSAMSVPAGLPDWNSSSMEEACNEGVDWRLRELRDDDSITLGRNFLTLWGVFFVCSDILDNLMIQCVDSSHGAKVVCNYQVLPCLNKITLWADRRQVQSSRQEGMVAEYICH